MARLPAASRLFFLAGLALTAGQQQDPYHYPIEAPRLVNRLLTDFLTAQLPAATPTKA